MDIKLIFRVILFHLTVVCVYPQSCTRSAQCPVGFCCRDVDGNLINGEGWEGGPIDNGPIVSGTCRKGRSKPDAVCTGRCRCQKGYTCYRTVTGIFMPTTCWKSQAAATDKKFWDNCRKNPQNPPDPKCLPPPSANPGPLNGAGK